jgi:hypothetical protein
MLRMLITVVCSVACLVLAVAMVGDAPNADGAITRHIVLIVGSRGTSCTGVAIARDLVLTAAHCVLPGAQYKLVRFDAARRPVLLDAAEIMRHPQFDLNALLAHRATADIALMKLAAPLPDEFAPAALAGSARPVAAAILSWSRVTASRRGVTARPAGQFAPRSSSPPDSRAPCNCGWSTRAPKASAPALARAPATPASPYSQTPVESSPWSASSAGRPDRGSRPDAGE